MKFVLIVFILSVISLQDISCQWMVTPDKEKYTIYDSKNDIGLEIEHFRYHNLSQLKLIVSNENIIGKVGKVKLTFQNGSDATTNEWNDYLIEGRFSQEANTLEFSNVLKMKNSSKFFLSKKLIIQIQLIDTTYKSVFDMTGIDEIKHNLSSYITFSDFSWRWDVNDCIYEL
jgi:hypothetical protein